MSKKRRSKCAAPQKSFLAACSKRNRFQPPASKCLPCSSPRSEHGILGKRRVKLRSPAVGRTPRGCQPDEQFRPRLSGTLWSAAVRVRGSRAQRRGRGAAELTSTARTEEDGGRLNSLQPRPKNGDRGERHQFSGASGSACRRRGSPRVRWPFPPQRPWIP